jgi:hypothetical protein
MFFWHLTQRSCDDGKHPKKPGRHFLHSQGEKAGLLLVGRKTVGATAQRRQFSVEFIGPRQKRKSVFAAFLEESFSHDSCGCFIGRHGERAAMLSDTEYFSRNFSHERSFRDAKHQKAETERHRLLSQDDEERLLPR